LAGLFESHRSAQAQIPDKTDWPWSFSPRQLQVLERLNEGKQNKIIAYELGMAESTVKVHIRHIMKKLSARNRTQVVLMTKNALQPRAASVAAWARLPSALASEPDRRASLAAVSQTHGPEPIVEP
jgi:DNA-binding CsgD family transcriptional regulator